MRTATLLPMLEISYTPEEEDGQGCLPEGVIQADRQALDKNERELSEVERKEITDKIFFSDMMCVGSGYAAVHCSYMEILKIKTCSIPS